MSERAWGRVSEPPPVVAAPAACPACRSTKVVAQGKAVSVETYWRCEACGEIWNVGRRRDEIPTRRW